MTLSSVSIPFPVKLEYINAEIGMTHDLLQKREALHPRHSQVRRDHIGNLSIHLGDGKWLAGNAHNFDSRIGIKNLLKCSEYNCRVIDNQNPDIFPIKSPCP